MLGGTYVNGWRILVTYTGTHVTDWLRTDQTTSASLAARPSRRTPTEYAVIDELGYLPFDTQTANLFFQLVAARYEQGSILITSNLSFGRWGEAFGDDTVTSAMIDHLVHHAEVLPMDGQSYRTRTRREMLSESESDDPGGVNLQPSIGGQVQPPLTSFWGTASMGCFQSSDMCARFRTAEEERQDQRRMRLLPMRLVRRIFHTHTPDPDETTGADRVPRLAPLPHRSYPTLPAHVRAHPPTPHPLVLER